MEQKLEEYKLVPVDDVHADQAFNCRGVINPVDVVDLSKDIMEKGLIEPVIIQEAPPGHISGAPYILVAGFRRHLAHIVGKIPEIKCIIRAPMNEVDARILNLSENMNRKNLNIVQEAKAIKPFFDLGMTEKHVQDKLGASRGWVQVRYILLKLPQAIQDEAEIGNIKQNQIRALYTHYLKTKDTVGVEDAVKAIFTMAKEMKEARAKGKGSITKTKSQKNVNMKRHRKRPEIFAMQALIFDQIGNNLATRALAWAAGEISDDEFHTILTTFADKINKTYKRPE